MSSKEVYLASNGARLYAGLDWRLLDATEKTEVAVRTTAKERGASYYALCESTTVETIKVGKKMVDKHRQSGGFFITLDDEGPAKKSHSLAAAFALWATEYPRVVLCTELATGGFVVVVVINGMPVQDRVLSTIEQAVDVVTGYTSETSTTVFASDLMRFPTAQEIEGVLDQIGAACTKATVIRPAPADMVTIAIVLLVVVAIGGGYWYYTKFKKEQARRAAAALAAAENPIPKYLSALSAQRASLGFERTAMIDSFASAQPLLVQNKGWSLHKVSCGRLGADQQDGCTTRLDRSYGTYAEIKTALPKLTLCNPTSSLDLNIANMCWKPTLTPQIVLPELITTEEFIRGMSGSQLQNWSLAGIQLKVQPATLWPKVAGVPASFKHPQAIAVGEFSLTGLSLPLLVEAIKSAPPNVIWSSWNVDVETPKKNSNPLDNAKVTLTGIYYVKN